MTLLQPYLSAGWLDYPDALHSQSRNLYAPRSSSDSLRDCACNDKPPGIYLREHPPYRADGLPSYEVELCGEWAGVWVKFMAYSLQTPEQIEKGIVYVKHAWQAVTEP